MKRPLRLTTGSAVIGWLCSVSTTSSRGSRSLTKATTPRVMSASGSSRAASARSCTSTRPASRPSSSTTNSSRRPLRRIWRSRSIASATVMPLRSGLTRGSIMRPAQSSG